MGNRAIRAREAARLLPPLARGGWGGRATCPCGTLCALASSSPLHLRPKFSHSLLRLANDSVPNPIQVLVHIAVQYPQDLNAIRSNHRVPTTIEVLPSRDIMCFPVQLDRQLELRGIKIDSV